MTLKTDFLDWQDSVFETIIFKPQTITFYRAETLTINPETGVTSPGDTSQNIENVQVEKLSSEDEEKYNLQRVGIAFKFRVADLTFEGAPRTGDYILFQKKLYRIQVVYTQCFGNRYKLICEELKDA